MRLSNLRWVREALLSVGRSSVVILHPVVLDVQLRVMLLVVLVPQVQDLHSKGTFAMLLLAHHVPGLRPLQLR